MYFRAAAKLKALAARAQKNVRASKRLSTTSQDSQSIDKQSDAGSGRSESFTTDSMTGETISTEQSDEEELTVTEDNSQDEDEKTK